MASKQSTSKATPVCFCDPWEKKIVTIADNQEEAVVADSSKIGKVAFARTGEVAAVSELISDRDAGPEAAEFV